MLVNSSVPLWTEIDNQLTEETDSCTGLVEETKDVYSWKLSNRLQHSKVKIYTLYNLTTVKKKLNQ
jgi:hypothetical protein